MNRFKPWVLFCILTAFTATSSVSHAGWWESFTNWVMGRKPGYTTVMVTSNYVEAVLLAELIQSKTKQPIILLPTGKESDKIYALNNMGMGAEFSKSKFTDVLERLSPKTVLFLGSEKYAPKEFKDKAEKIFPIAVIEGDDFKKVAEAAGAVMRMKKLGPTYAKMAAKISSKGKVKPDPDSIWSDIAIIEEGATTDPTAKGPSVTPGVRK